MSSRHVVAMSVLTALVPTSGCIGFLTDEEALTFESEPATADVTATGNAGYEMSGTKTFAMDRTLSFGRQERQIATSNHVTTYEKTLNLGFFGEVKLSSFSIILTPAIEATGQPWSPIGDCPSDDLIRLADNRYQGLSDVDQVSSRSVQMLGQTINTTRHSATMRFDGDKIDVHIHMTKIQHNGDFVVAVGLYPQQLDGEEENVLELTRSAERPFGVQVAPTSRLRGAFFSPPRVGGSMTCVRTASITMTVLGVVGYGVRILAAYSGRAFSVMTIMIDITL